MASSSEAEADKKASTSKRPYRVLLVIISIYAVIQVYNRKGTEDNTCTSKTERRYPVMGTFAHTVIYGEPDAGEKASDTVRDVFLKIEGACNIFNPESEISRLNKTACAKPFKCSPLLWNIFISSRRAYDISGGAFDVSARPLMLLWGFYRKRGDNLPSAEEIKEAKTKVGLDKIIFDDENHTVRFKEPGMSVDFGGIAKGIAVQAAVDKIKKLGVKHGVIDLGGNLYCLGSPPAPKKFYTVGIRAPLAGNRTCAKLALRNQAVATSGNYARYVTIRGRHYAHIMNPRTGMPVEDMLSVTVISPSADDSDFLATSVFVNGVEFAENLCKTNPEVGVFIMKRDPENKSKTKVFQFGNVKKL